MSDATSVKTNSAYEEAIVIDGCSISVTEWCDRIETSGATALVTSVTYPRHTAEQALLRIQEHHAIIRAEKRFGHVRSVADIHRYKKEGRVGVVMGAANTDMLGRETSLVEVFYDAGLRVMQFNYNERNFAADGCLEASNAGLSTFGRDLVQAMNEVGMVIDLADTGIKSSLEAIEASTKPVFFSHVNPRATALEQQHNVTDEQIKAVAGNGGVIGLVPYAPLNAVTPGVMPTIDDYIGHIQYVVDLVGIDHVAIGSDSEATPGTTSPEYSFHIGKVAPGARGASDSIGAISLGMGIKSKRTKPMTYLEMATALQGDNWGSKGIEGIHKLPNLADALAKSGWSDADMQKFMGGNMLRVFEANWPTAE